MALALLADRDASPHPGDGQGLARIVEQQPETIRAGESGRWVIDYQAAGPGIDIGGSILFQAPPFWGWSTPQVDDPTASGFTEVSTASEGVSLVATTLDQQLLGIRIVGKRLAAGEVVRIDYGAGKAGARTDRYAEHRSRFWIGVDADGDGHRELVDSLLAVDISAGPIAGLVAFVPATAEPGDQVMASVSALDRGGNAGVDFLGSLSVEVDGPAQAPEILRFTTADRGSQRFPLQVTGEGIVRFRVTSESGMIAESNPMTSSIGTQRILWADLHGHSGISDGTGTPNDYFSYARDVARLDIAALTDHDHWGMQPLSTDTATWDEIRREVNDFHQPGTFVTILGYEWTSWLHGHRHVLYFDNQGDVLSSVDPAFDTPTKLWTALEDRQALTFAHHSAGGPIAVDWGYPPDPLIEPVTEIVSVHGSSEAADTPGRIYRPVHGNSVRDVLDFGYRLGFIGSGDSHDGHPGLAHLGAPSGGMAAILADELDRESVLEALRERRVYATNGPRIVLRSSLDGQRLGSSLPQPDGPIMLKALVVAPHPLERIEVIRSGEIVARQDILAERFATLDLELAGLIAGEYVYIRVQQTDGGAAWSSPFFIIEGSSSQ